MDKVTLSAVKESIKSYRQKIDAVWEGEPVGFGSAQCPLCWTFCDRAGGCTVCPLLTSDQNCHRIDSPYRTMLRQYRADGTTKAGKVAALQGMVAVLENLLPEQEMR